MEKFVKFMDKTGFNLISVIVAAILGYLIIRNLM